MPGVHVQAPPAAGSHRVAAAPTMVVFQQASSFKPAAMLRNHEEHLPQSEWLAAGEDAARNRGIRYREDVRHTSSLQGAELATMTTVTVTVSATSPAAGPERFHLPLEATFRAGLFYRISHCSHKSCGRKRCGRSPGRDQRRARVRVMLGSGTGLGQGSRSWVVVR